MVQAQLQGMVQGVPPPQGQGQAGIRPRGARARLSAPLTALSAAAGPAPRGLSRVESRS
eukprot:SAG22_NODE_390_length_11235_cov_26.293732_9_plen_59_part_00